jgi:hypothetical protein
MVVECCCCYDTCYSLLAFVENNKINLVKSSLDDREFSYRITVAGCEADHLHENGILGSDFGKSYLLYGIPLSPLWIILGSGIPNSLVKLFLAHDDCPAYGMQCWERHLCSVPVSVKIRLTFTI